MRTNCGGVTDIDNLNLFVTTTKYFEDDIHAVRVAKMLRAMNDLNMGAIAIHALRTTQTRFQLRGYYTGRVRTLGYIETSVYEPRLEFTKSLRKDIILAS